MSLLVYSIAWQFNRSYDIVDHKYVFINFNGEKILSLNIY